MTEPTHNPATTAEITGDLARYRAVLASTLDPIVTIDARGTIQVASDSVERVFGWKPDELVGQNVRILMPEPHRSAHDDYLKTYSRTGVTNILGRTREFEAAHRDGTRFPIELSVSRVQVSGSDEQLFTGIIHDISDRKQADEELAQYRNHLEDLVAERTAELATRHEQLRLADRLASIGTLAAGLGHDMNNVLLPIRTRLDAFEAADLPKHLISHLHAIRRSVEYLQHLTDGLHLFAQDPDDPETAIGVTDVATWWNQIGPLLTAAVPNSADLVCRVPRSLPKLVIPPHQLTQAMLNLVVNAGEALPESRGRVTIWAEARDEGESVAVGVTDEGIGMPADVQRRILDPFFTTKKRGLGTGLGLSLVQLVAQGVGGSITIDSKPGRGTTVTLTVPAAPAPKTAHDVNGKVAVVSVTDRRSATLIGASLETAGFHVQYDASADPTTASIWVTDPSAAARAAAASLGRQPGRAVVVMAPEDPTVWETLGALVITNRDDFEEIRRQVGAAIQVLVETG